MAAAAAASTRPARRSGNAGHALTATAVTAPQRLSTGEFIEQVRRRPAIWRAGVVDKSGKKVASAWRQICMLTWPDFGTWPADTKRTRCLELQYQWKKLKKSFQIEYFRQQKATGKQQNGHPEFKDYDKLTFLKPTIPKDKKTERAAKDEEESDEERDGQNSEDKKFLLSLLSHMQEVPRSKKLALRSEMIQLVTKYIPSKDLETS